MIRCFPKYGLASATLAYAGSFCAYFGTPVGYCKAGWLEKARKISRSIRVAIAEIANRIGLDNPGCLPRIIRRRFGGPPSELR